MSDETDVSDDAIRRGVEIANEIVDEIFDREDDEDETYDPISVVFSLFINSIHILHECGWTTQEMVNEVFNHTHEQLPPGETLQ